MAENLKINNNGTALLITLFIFTSVLVVALGTASIVLTGVKMGRRQAQSTKAFFASEAGIERGLWEARKGGFNYDDCPASGECMDFSLIPAECDICSNTKEILSNNSSYNVSYASTSPYIYLTSLGRFGTVRRSVKVRYTY